MNSPGLSSILFTPEKGLILPGWVLNIREGVGGTPTCKLYTTFSKIFPKKSLILIIILSLSTKVMIQH